MTNKGVTRGQALQTRKMAIDKGVHRDAYQSALDDGTLARFLDTIKERKSGNGVQPTIDLATGICRFTVDFGRSLEQMIADGHYDRRNNDITAARFPISGSGKVRVEGKLFPFNRYMSSDQVERELDAAGYRVATIAELLAFGASFPDVQRQFPVVALGSVAMVCGYRYVACLGRDGARRSLHLGWRDDDWRDCYRFLAVRK